MDMAIPHRLTTSIPVTVPTTFDVDEAAARLQAALGLHPGATSLASVDRVLDGTIRDDRTIELRVTEADWRHRRKSWNVTLEGRLDRSDNGAVVRGAIGIVEGARLQLWMRVFRLLALVPIALAAVTILAGGLGGSVAWAPAGFGFLVGATSWAGLRILQESGEEAAATDSRWLLERVQTILRRTEGSTTKS